MTEMEKIAKAWHELEFDEHSDNCWELLSRAEREVVVNQTALKVHVLNAAGYAIVSREPTEAMREAGGACLYPHKSGDAARGLAGNVFIAMNQAGELRAQDGSHGE